MIENPKLPEIVNPNFHPSPTKRVVFPGRNGSIDKTFLMNRKQRRANHLYGDRLVKVKK